ncbi:nucleoside deaminase [Halosquirtibacter laminarini]|uniref:Nucleoside deaminase n=1 Tax=Halosquirtibacter laminarini TaxID=3374600 RepID=A0AC61NMY5_9BACT|nr:nucleoside deaminase [Prolixibacteraceae bacterium]
MEPFNDNYFMKQALIEADIAFQEGEIPIGAIIVSEGHIIGKGHNRTECLNDVTAHAEMQAITAAAETLGGKYLNNCTLYVTVEPCSMCAGALGWSQISKVVYGTGDNKRGFTNISPKALHPKTEITAGVLEEQCKEMMDHFFKTKRG